jgi:hypothetical protein
MAGLRTVSYTFLLGLATLGSGCVVHEHDPGYASRQEAYRDGYYDAEHKRYYHDNAWHDCVVDDPYCHN